MEYILIGLTVIACVLLLILLLRGRNTGEAVDRETLEKYFRLQRKELLENMQTVGRMQADMSQNAFYQMEERLASLESSNKQELEAMREAVSRRLREIQADNAAQLEKIRGTVDEKLQKLL